MSDVRAGTVWEFVEWRVRDYEAHAHNGALRPNTPLLGALSAKWMDGYRQRPRRCKPVHWALVWATEVGLSPESTPLKTVAKYLRERGPWQPKVRNVGATSIAVLVDVLKEAGIEAEIHDGKKPRPPLVPRCEHCGQRLPKGMR